MVALGAGFDTFGCRNTGDALRVYEVDHPATQASKRAMLSAAGIAAPPTLVFAPCNFERETLADALAAAGFDAHAPAFFSWLGVTPYLTRAAVDGALRFVASRPAGSAIVFDFAVPPDVLTPTERRVFDAHAARVASLGEPWVSFFDAADLARDLERMGFASADVMTPELINRRYFDGRADGMHVGKLGHLMHARVAAPRTPG